MRKDQFSILQIKHVKWTTSGLEPNVATKLVKEEDGSVTLGCEATGILPPKLLRRPEIIWFKRKRVSSISFLVNFRKFVQ